MSISMVPLTGDRVPDLADLFGQGGDPKWCWYRWQVGREIRSVFLVGHG